MMRRCFRCMKMRDPAIMRTRGLCWECYPNAPQEIPKHGVKGYRAGCRCVICWRLRPEPRTPAAISRDQIIEDVTHLLVFDVPVRDIARRLGYRIDTLQRALYRWGRADLARPFEHETRHNRNRPGMV